MIRGETPLTGAFGYARDFWRFANVQNQVAKLAQTAIEFSPMQDPTSFNLEAINRQIEAIKSHAG